MSSPKEKLQRQRPRFRRLSGTKQAIAALLFRFVQKITGADVGVFITDNIIHKLGLRQTSYPIRDDLPGGLHGYGWNPKTGRFDDKTEFNPALGGSAGAMISSLVDLGEYVRVLCTGGLLRPETQRARMEG